MKSWSSALNEGLQMPEIILCNTALVLTQQCLAAGFAVTGLDGKVNQETKVQCSGGLARKVLRRKVLTRPMPHFRCAITQ